MNLPHQEPLLFAREILLKSDEKVEVLCIFPIVPTLPMFIEAAAQSSIAFDQDDQIKIGFLTTVKEVMLLCDIEEKVYLFKLKKESDLMNYKQFLFEAYSKEKRIKTVSGHFTIVIEE